MYYEANTANGIIPRNKVELQKRRTHFQLALSACENMEIPLSELKERLNLNPEEAKKWSEFAFKEWGRLLVEEQRLLKNIMKSDLERYKDL